MHACNALKALVLAAGLCSGLAAHAAIVMPEADGQWHFFDVLPQGAEWVDLDGDALGISIVNARPVMLSVVDAGFSGDVFELRDNGQLMGQTSDALHSYPDSVALDVDAAWLDSAYSRGSYLLLPGSHLITGALKLSALDDMGQPLDATVGAFRVSAVPEPQALEMTVAGLLSLGLGLAARQRRR